MGFILNSDGRIKPRAPRNSDIPINLTSHTGKSFAHGSEAVNTSLPDFNLGISKQSSALNTGFSNQVWAGMIGIQQLSSRY